MLYIKPSIQYLMILEILESVKCQDLYFNNSLFVNGPVLYNARQLSSLKNNIQSLKFSLNYSTIVHSGELHLICIYISQ